MPLSVRGLVAVPVCVAAVAALAACSSDSGQPAPTTVTVSGSAGPSASASAATAPSDASTSSAPATSSSVPPPGASVTLARCDTVLPLGTVEKAVGRSVVGRTLFVVNLPDPSTSQLARIDCQYGLPAAAARPTAKATGKTTAPATKTSAPAAPAVPQVEVSVSVYATAASAAARIPANVTSTRQHGGTSHQVAAGAHRATVLLGYGAPLLVMAVGVRTVAVSLKDGIVSTARRDGALSALAAAALHGAGG